jgi:hypothetical protein
VAAGPRRGLGRRILSQMNSRGRAGSLAALTELAGVAERYADSLVDHAAGVRLRADAVAEREVSVAARSGGSGERARLHALAVAEEEYVLAIAAQNHSVVTSRRSVDATGAKFSFS